MAGGYGKGIPEGRPQSFGLWVGISAILTLALLFLWYPALHGRFVFDDQLLVKRNPLVHGPLDLWGIFGGRFLEASAGQESVPFWRPVTVLIFWGLWHLGNGTAIVFHTFALGTHLLVALLGLRLLSRMGVPPLLAGLGAFGFAGHPAQVEGLAWVSAASLPLMMLLLFLFLLAWEHYLRRGGIWVLCGGVLAFSLALLVREDAIMGLLLAVLLEFLHPEKKGGGHGMVKRLGLLSIVALLWFLSRYFVLNPSMSRLGSGILEATRGVGEGLLLRLYVFGVHLRDLVFPRAPNVLRPLPAELLGEGSGLGVALTWVAGFSLLLFWLLLRGKGDGFWMRLQSGTRKARGLLWVFLCLLPLLIVGEGMGVTPLADRYHAFAVFGWILFLTDLRFFPWGKWGSLALLLGSCALYLPVTHAGMKPWRDPRSFWENASLQNLDSVLAAYSLGRQRLMDFEREGNPRDLDGAGEELDRALALRRSFGNQGKRGEVQELAIETARAWVQLTRAMRSPRVSPRSARGAFERVLKRAPGSADAWVGLGVSLVLEKRVGEAERAFRKAVGLDPRNPQAHFNLGRLLWAKGARAEAQEQIQEVLRIQPDNRGARELLRRLKGW